MSRAVMQQALEALVTCCAEEWRTLNNFGMKQVYDEKKVNAAIAALHAALAEPEQEMTKQKPLAWTDGRGFIASHADSFPRGTTVSPLYAHPPTPRKPLTDEEIALIVGECAASAYQHDDFSFARAIERAHGIGGGE